MFFPSNNLVRASCIALGALREDTCGMRWSLIESAMILFAITNFFLAQIPWMKESHDLGRPFNVVITISAFSTSSSITSSCSLIWETLVKYDWMVSSFWILTFFNWFLRVIFRLMFFPSNSLVRASNMALGVLREDTYGMRWSLIESTMILFSITNFFLCKAFSSSPSGTGTSSLI